MKIGTFIVESLFIWLSGSMDECIHGWMADWM